MRRPFQGAALFTLSGGNSLCDLRRDHSDRRPFLRQHMMAGVNGRNAVVDVIKQCADVFSMDATRLGQGRVQPDPLKAAQAVELELELGLTTLSDAPAERGRDFEATLEERKAERDMLREAGLHNDPPSTPSGPNGDPSEDDPPSNPMKRISR